MCWNRPNVHRLPEDETLVFHAICAIAVLWRFLPGVFFSQLFQSKLPWRSQRIIARSWFFWNGPVYVQMLQFYNSVYIFFVKSTRMLVTDFATFNFQDEVNGKPQHCATFCIRRGCNATVIHIAFSGFFSCVLTCPTVYSSHSSVQASMQKLIHRKSLAHAAHTCVRTRRGWRTANSTSKFFLLVRKEQNDNFHGFEWYFAFQWTTDTRIYYL